MGSIGSWMSPSVRMTAASGIGRQLATWLSCARWPSTSSVTAEQPRSACGRVASRLPGMMSTCCLYWLDDFMRRPWGLPVFPGPDPHDQPGHGTTHKGGGDAETDDPAEGGGLRKRSHSSFRCRAGLSIVYARQGALPDPPAVLRQPMSILTRVTAGFYSLYVSAARICPHPLSATTPASSG